MIRERIAIVFLAVWVLASSTSLASAAEVFINQVNFRSVINLNTDDLSQNFSCLPGTVFSEQIIDECIKQLMQRKVFSFIEAEYKSVNAGIDVTFILTPRLKFGRVRFDGAETLEHPVIQRAIRSRSDDYLSYDSVQQSVDQILSRYRDEGFRQAQVKVELTEADIPPQVDVRFRIVEGVRSRIRSMTVDGDIPPELEDERALLQSFAVGLPASRSGSRRLKGLILGVVRRAGYLQASAEIKEVFADPETGEVDLSVTLYPREPLSVSFEGNDSFSREELLEPLKLDSRQVPFSVGAIKTLVKEIESLYRRSGFYRVSVREQEEFKGTDERHFKIIISEGARYRIQSVRFKGNSTFAGRELRPLVQTKRAGFLLVRQFQPGYLSPDLLRNDQQRIRDFYFSKGFRDVEVEHHVQIDDQNSELQVEFVIVEGELKTVRSVEVEWTNVIDSTESAPLPFNPLAASLRTKVVVGDPVDIKKFDEERARILELLVSSGFPNASCEYVLDPDNLNLRFVVSPGLNVSVGKIWFEGNVYTHDYVLSRELLFETGEAWDQTSIDRSGQSLYGLGFFRSVAIEPTDGKLDEQLEDVSVKVKERDPASMDLAAAFTTQDGLQLTSQIAQRNLFGRGRAVVLGVEGFLKPSEGIFDAGRARAAFAVPRFLGTPVDASIEGYLQTSLEFIDQYSFDRYGIQPALRYPLFLDLRGNLKFNFFNERLFDVKPDVVIGDHDLGTTIYSIVETEVEIDKRDDAFNPKGGWRSLISARYSAEALGSEVSFYGLSGQHSVYTALDEQLVWANNVKLEALVPFGETESIPLGRRLFLGGRESLRGFSKYSVGPRGLEGNVLGGDHSYQFSTELRYRLTESLITVGFLDIGQSILQAEDEFLGDPLSLSLNDLRFSPGGGLHYETPIGPISLEVGFATEREFGERWGRVLLSIGSAF